MAAYSDAWTPPRTPKGRPLHRIRRLQGSYLEEVIGIIAEGQLAHITIQGLTDIYHHQDLRMIPVTGLSPMLIVPVWHTANRNPMIQAFTQAQGNHDLLAATTRW